MAIDEPSSPLPALDIPVIDISGYLAGDIKATKTIALQLNAAAQAPGFFQIVGHDIPADLRETLLDRVVAFFALPADQKNALHRNNSKALRGFETLGEQQLEPGYADVKEGFMVGAEVESKNARFLQGPNQWPAKGQGDGLEGTFMEYFHKMRDLSRIMFRLVALSLSLDESFFDDFASGQDSIAMCRAHMYPPVSLEASLKSRGIGAHTDFGALTLLLQDDVGGLEVFHRKTETWHPVKVVKDAFVVNVGDMLERWTNNHYTSSLHRVTSPISDKYRYSVAFFNEGLLDQTIECIPTCLADGEIPLYEAVRVEEHLRQRYGSSYLV
ncbi:putative gibberellin 20 oxidase [Aureobasidium namibiae CBS 147.97]|uniref:Putative gibberellin 20 oxidase n=1 Tax=Aureobasidium namibiae CBS 147.97 TaxID=1043004 RepID=A0A074WCI6_9PEZI